MYATCIRVTTPLMPGLRNGNAIDARRGCEMRCANCEYEMTFSDRLLHRTATGYYCPSCWAVISEDENAPKAPKALLGPGDHLPSPLVELSPQSVLAETLRLASAKHSPRTMLTAD